MVRAYNKYKLLLIYFRKMSFWQWTIVSSCGKWCQLFSTILVVFQRKNIFLEYELLIFRGRFFIFGKSMQPRRYIYLLTSIKMQATLAAHNSCSKGKKCSHVKVEPENAFILKYCQYFFIDDGNFQVLQRNWKLYGH